MRFVIADDQNIARMILKRIVTQDLGFDVVGEATNGQEALSLCRRSKPDAVIFDISMPVLNGADAARAVISEGLASYVFIASSNGQDAVFKPLQGIGCVTISKPYTTEKLTQEIRAHIGG